MRRISLSLSIFLLLAVPLFASESVTSLAALYERPTVGASKAVTGVTFQHAHLRITLSQGSAAPVLAGQETIGLFFQGKGELEYVSTEPVEAAAMTSNLKRATRIDPVKSDKGLTVRDTFTEAFLWIAGAPSPALGDTAGTDLTAAFAAHREVLANEQNAPVSFPFIQQKLDAPARPVIRGEFRGGRETLVYLYDSIGSKRESLVALQKIPNMDLRRLKNALFPIEISSVPTTGTLRDFIETPFILAHLQYTLTATGNENGTLSAVETIVPRGAAQRVFRFRLYNDILDANEKQHFYNVRKVTSEDGKELPFLHREDELIVSLPAPAAQDKPLKLAFEIDGDFLYRAGGDSYWQLGTWPWYPQPERKGVYMTVHSTVKVPKPFVPFTPGTTVARRVEGELNVVETKLEKPVQFTVAHAGRYAFSEEDRNGIIIRVASYAGKNERASKQLTNLASSMIEFYQRFLGPFPYKEFNIIELNTLGRGQAPPGTMFVSAEAFNPTLGWANQLYSEGVNHLFAHEIAHQYWGHVVKWGSEEEQWLSEAFAEYCSSLIVKEMKKADTLTPKWRANAAEAAKWSSIPTANRLNDFVDWNQTTRMRTYLVYDKGAYLLSRLHKELGDKHFLTFLRTFQGVYAWKMGVTKELPAMIQKISGKDYTAFFEEHFWGTGMPKD